MKELRKIEGKLVDKLLKKLLTTNPPVEIGDLERGILALAFNKKTVERACFFGFLNLCTTDFSFVYCHFDRYYRFGANSI